MAKIRVVIIFIIAQVVKPTLTADQQNNSSLTEPSDMRTSLLRVLTLPFKM